MNTFITVANELSNHWAEAMWPALWQSAILAALLLILTRLSRRATPSLRFWLWMLIPLRLLIMPVISISVPALPAPAPVEPIYVASESAAPVFAATATAVMAEAFGLAQIETMDETFLGSVETASPVARPGLLTYVMALWVAGLIVVILRIARSWQHVGRVKAKSKEVREGRLHSLAVKAASALGLEKLPRIIVTNEASSPVVFGLFRPTVAIPQALLDAVSEREIMIVFAHEFAHLKRRDPLVGWILAVTEVLYFFHPVLHFAKRKIMLEREKACDEFVLATCRARASVYARALVRAAEVCGQAPAPIGPSAMMAESFGDLKKRLLSIGSNMQPTARLSRGGLALLLILGLVCVPGITLEARIAIATTSPHADDVEETQELQAAQVAALPSDDSETQTLDTKTISGPTVTLHFPKDKSLGSLFVKARPVLRKYLLGPNYNVINEWDYWANAIGEVEVPAGKKIKLSVSNDAQFDLSPLQNLGPNDLDTLNIECPENFSANADVTMMPYIGKLTGLRSLTLFMVNISHRGARHLRNLRSLEELYLYTNHVDDKTLSHIVGMRQLEVLVLSKGITDKGLNHLRTLTSLRELRLQVHNIRGPGLKNLEALPELRHLGLWGENLGDSGLRYIEGLTQLKRIELRERELNITDLGLLRIAKLTGLEELSMVRISDITDKGLAHLAPLKSLKLLNLNSGKISDEGLAHLKALESLEELRLPYSKNISDEGLKHIAELSNLRKLSVGGFKPADITLTGPFTDEGLLHLSKLEHLEKLGISSGMGITDVGMHYIAKHKKLKELSLMCNGITNVGLGIISSMKSLENIWLPAPNTGKMTVSGVSQLNRLTGLKTLSVSGMTQDNTGLNLSGLSELEILMLWIRDKPGRGSKGALRDQDMAGLANLKQLKWLQVGNGTEFSDRGMACLEGMDNLDRLNIGGDKVTDEGLAYVADKKMLNALYLSKGNFTDEGLKHLEGLKALRTLQIKNTHGFSQKALDQLWQKLPILSSINRQMMGFGGSASN